MLSGLIRAMEKRAGGGVNAKGGEVGRGVVDDKAAIVQAMLAMAALEKSGVPRTQTIRLLVGCDEESGSRDLGTYQESHKAPDLSVVLDSSFPVVVGEKAWNALTTTRDSKRRQRASQFQPLPQIAPLP